MSAKSLAEKLLIKPGHRVLVIDAPRSYATALDPLPAGAKLARDRGGAIGARDAVHLFVATQSALAEHAPRAIAAANEGAVLWIAYPKQTGKVASDLTRDRGWGPMHDAGYEGVAIVAVDEDWAAMRFKRRSDGEKGRSHAPAKRAATPRALDVPSDLAEVIARDPAAKARWEAWSFTHRREYVEWIASAKKPETRARRLAAAAARIASGKPAT